MIEVNNLHKSFSNTGVLRGIDFKVDKGEVISVIGPSGSGKTTLLRCISFLEKADKGTMVFDGISYEMNSVSAKDIRQLRRKMGFVFQGFNLFNNMTVRQNVAEGLVMLRKMDKSDADDIAMKVLDKVDLSNRADFYPGELSGGQQQRVSIARAIAYDPEILLLDEPTSALDPELTGEVLDVIKKLAKEGTTMVVVTHEMEFALEISSRVTFMENGFVVEEGKAEQVLLSPKEDRTRQFLLRTNHKVRLIT